MNCPRWGGKQIEDLLRGTAEPHAFGRDDKRPVDQDRMRVDRFQQRLVAQRGIVEAEILERDPFSRRIWRRLRPARPSNWSAAGASAGI